VKQEPEPNKARYRRIVAIILVCYWVALFIGTHGPAPNLSRLPENTDKGLHFLAYAGLAFLLGLWMSTRYAMRLRHYLAALALTAVYGVIDECLQLLVDRHADIYDAYADWTGSVLGLSALYVVRRSMGRSSKVRGSQS